jgi:hypothetical protein
MPQRDRHHMAVRRALEKIGWVITHDPLILPFDTTRVFVDLTAHQVGSNGVPGNVSIEIKVFSGSPFVDELEGALGQYILYRGLLDLYHPHYALYLAVPQSIYETRFQGRDILYVLSQNQIRLMVYNEKREEIVQWIQ